MLQEFFTLRLIELMQQRAFKNWFIAKLISRHSKNDIANHNFKKFSRFPSHLIIKFSGIFSRKFFTRLGLRLAKNFQDSPGYWNVLNFIRPFHVINAVNHFNFTKFKEENFSSLLVKLLFCCCDEGLTESLQVRSDLLDSNWELLEPKRRGFYYSMKTWQNALALLTVLWGNITTTATVDHWRR